MTARALVTENRLTLCGTCNRGQRVAQQACKDECGRNQKVFHGALSSFIWPFVWVISNLPMARGGFALPKIRWPAKLALSFA
jgi:hypothetical protein